MTNVSTLPISDIFSKDRAQELFDQQRQAVFVRTDHLFGVLLIVQWFAGILMALFVSPVSWEGTSSSIHVHVWTAVILGAAISSLPIWLVLTHPGAVVTRHSIAIAQTLYSALFIHLSGGRIETHFHIFGSLAFLAFYRDWRVLVTATIVVALDHIVRGQISPQSVYGITTASPWRWLEHAFWVLFEDLFLIRGCLQNTHEMAEIAIRQAELEGLNQLKAHEERFRALSDLSPVGIFQMDALGNCTFVNPRWTEITNFSLPQSEDTGWQHAIHPDDRKTFVREWSKSLSAGTKFAIESRINTKDGAICWVQFLANAVRDESGSVYMFVGTIDDITEQKKAALATGQLARIVELTSDAVYSYDLSGNVSSWNEAAAMLYGYESAEIMGKNLSVLLPTVADAPGSNDLPLILNTIAGGLSLDNYETVRIKKDGTAVDVALTAAPLKDAAGCQAGVSIIARDITLKKEAEKRISEFYSMISHELRTPLTSIRGALSLLDEGFISPSEEEGKELISIARSSSARLIRLINEILDLRKIEAGKLTLNMQVLDAKAMVDNALSGMRGMAAELGVNLESDVLSDCQILADSDRIIQIITNLVSNAVKFSSAGMFVRVQVSKHAGQVRFAVIDQGPGIPLEEQHKLFGKFQQLDSTDSRPKEGTGLGLAICKALVEEHKGTIGVDSKAGDGSTFYFELPLHRSGTAVMAPPVKLNQLLVLVVEDDADLATVLSTQLRLEGYACVTVGTKSACLQFLQEQVPDAMLLDLCLPDGDGLEVIELLRAQPRLSKIPTIVMTGDASAKDFGLPMIFDLILKPFDQATLLGSLERAVEKTTTKRVLIVDDDDNTRAVIAAQLKSLKVECLQASDGIEAMMVVKEWLPDLMILDVGMPNFDGFSVVEWLRTVKRTNLPLIVYSGQDLTVAEQESLSLRLTRHLVKGRATEEEFLCAVTGLLRTVTQGQSTAADHSTAA